MADEARPIIIKRIKKISGGAHGGAWKVAYADFVTAMMAFFMLLWLLNVTTKVQKEGLADYFTPAIASTSAPSGAGDILGGTSLDSDGAQDSSMSVAIPTTTSQEEDSEDEVLDPQKAEEDALAELAAQREENYFQRMGEELKVAIQKSPELSKLKDQILIEVTKDGLRIQLVDKDNRALFRTGTAELYKYAENMLRKIATVVEKMTNRISITGHTDATPFYGKGGYSNWELSADRANASRRVLNNAGVSTNRVAEVLGKAATEPLDPYDPLRSENRRISILLIREATVLPKNFK